MQWCHVSTHKDGSDVAAKHRAGLLRLRIEELVAKRGVTDMPDDVSGLLDAARRLSLLETELERRNEELVRGRAAVEQSRAELEELFGRAPVAYFAFDKEGYIRRVNDEGASLLGRDARSILGSQFTTFVVRASHNAFRLHLARVMETGGKEKTELTLKRVAAREALVSVESVHWGRKPQIDVLSTLIDITESRRKEDEYRQLVMAMDQARSEILIIDRKGVIKYANLAFSEMVDYPIEGLVGKSSLMFKSNLHDERFYDDIRSSLSSRGAWSGHLSGRRGDGSRFDTETAITPVKDDLGRATGFIVVGRDVTKEVMLESELERARKLETMGFLAGGVAHDFNNILASLIGYAELALEDLPDGSPVRHFVAEIHKAGLRGKDLVRQILTFTRQMKPEQTPLVLPAVIREALSLLKTAVPENIEVEQHLADEPAAVVASPVQLQQIIMNLGINAAQAMRDRRGKVTFTLSSIEFASADEAPEQMMRPGRYFKLTVQDDGPGIDAETLSHVFEPFFTTKEPGEGTGIGLAVVQGVVKSLNGTIAVESELGKGTTFTVYLPKAELPVRPVREEERRPAPKGQERILFVDDEPAIVEMERRTMERMGYRVETRTDGFAALETFKASPLDYDLVITDQKMPRMSGMDLARKITEIRPDIPVILSTGYSESVSPEGAKAAGIQEYIMKPVVMRELAETIRRVLDKK